MSKRVWLEHLQLDSGRAFSRAKGHEYKRAKKRPSNQTGQDGPAWAATDTRSNKIKVNFTEQILI